MKRYSLLLFLILTTLSTYGLQYSYFHSDGERLVTLNDYPNIFVQVWDISSGELYEKFDFEFKSFIEGQLIGDTLIFAYDKPVIKDGVHLPSLFVTVTLDINTGGFSEVAVPSDWDVYQKKTVPKHKPKEENKIESNGGDKNVKVVVNNTSEPPFSIEFQNLSDPAKSSKYQIEYKKKDATLNKWVYHSESNLFIYAIKRKNNFEIYKKEAGNGGQPELITSFSNESGNIISTKDENYFLAETSTDYSLKNGRLLWTKSRSQFKSNTMWNHISYEIDFPLNNRFIHNDMGFFISGDNFFVMKRGSENWIMTFNLSNGNPIGSYTPPAKVYIEAIDLANERLTLRTEPVPIINMVNGKEITRITTLDEVAIARWKERSKVVAKYKKERLAEEAAERKTDRIADYALALDQSGVRFNYRTVNSFDGFVRLDLYVTNTTSKTMTGTFEIEILGKGSGPNLGTLLDPVYRDMTGNKYEVNFCLQPSHLMEKQFDAKDAIAPLSNVKVKLLSVKEGDCP